MELIKYNNFLFFEALQELHFQYINIDLLPDSRDLALARLISKMEHIYKGLLNLASHSL